MRRHGVKTVVLTVLVLALSLWCGGASRAETRIAKNAEIQATPEEVKELMAAFGMAEEAIRTKNLEMLMAFYSKNYGHLGSDRNGILKIWAVLFHDYTELISGHTFTRISVQRGKNMASVLCTGAMFGINARTGEKERIDSWIEEIHYLSYEDGKWKIMGHEVEAPEQGRFGIAMHPLF